MKLEKQLNILKTILFIVCIFTVALLFFIAPPCHAAMLATMSSVSTTTVGQVFTVDVYAVPQGTKDKPDTSYVAGMQLEYHDAKFISWESNKEFIKVRTEKLWNNYDWYISRTFGFPGGFNKTKKLGTATFESTKEGKIDVGLLDGFVLNAESKNTFK